jgi:hypothetical protein
VCFNGLRTIAERLLFASCFAYAERLVLLPTLRLYRKRCGSSMADDIITTSLAVSVSRSLAKGHGSHGRVEST